MQASQTRCDEDLTVNQSAVLSVICGALLLHSCLEWRAARTTSSDMAATL